MIVEALAEVGFLARIVSSKDAVGVIQAHIVQNLFDNEIVVVDVSGKNPNVMFELGMRLAFDKPVVIIKDELTNYSFDTSPVEHLNYRSDLRYQAIVDFKKDLGAKVTATYQARSDKNHATFLKQFGRVNTASLGEKEGGAFQAVLEELASMRSDLRSIGRPATFSPLNLRRSLAVAIPTSLGRDEFTDQIAENCARYTDGYKIRSTENGYFVEFDTPTKSGNVLLRNELTKMFPSAIFS